MSTTVSIKQLEQPWSAFTDQIVLGKDLLEVVSTSMYVDPLCMYREYIQNAADSIDDARQSAVLRKNDEGRVSIDIDRVSRTVRIRDNGAGLEAESFVRTITAFGASKKRNSNQRGLRGIGRLSGLAYCQELLFRSKQFGERFSSEISWDCGRLKTLLRDPAYKGNLQDLLSECVTFRRTAADPKDHFFEVELRKVIRHGRDTLLNGDEISRYLSQVAPVPFHPDFSHAEKIEPMLSQYVEMANLNISVSGVSESIVRPYRDQIVDSKGKQLTLKDVELLTLPSVDCSSGAIVWLLHHTYEGAIRNDSVRGLRLRSGNIQIGNSEVLQSVFQEGRFNKWTVGEVHILDRRIAPNARRDYCEQNVHLENLLNHLAPITQSIAKRARNASSHRNNLRHFTALEKSIFAGIAILRQGSETPLALKTRTEELAASIQQLEKIAKKIDSAEKSEYARRVSKLSKALARAKQQSPAGTKFLKKKNALIYRKVFSLIYRHSSDQTSARKLVEKMLKEL